MSIVGESGAGKTTLVDLHMGRYAPATGQVVLDKKLIIKESNRLAFRQLFFYLPLAIFLKDKLIKQNIAFGQSDQEIDLDRVWHCLEQVQLKIFVHNLVDRENTSIGENGVCLSGGQRQRIGIARALYQQPEILVMDEGTSALDNNTERHVSNILADLKNLTIITMAHRLSTVKNYDLIYFISGGNIEGFGTYQELIQKCEKFRLMTIAME